MSILQNLQSDRSDTRSDIDNLRKLVDAWFAGNEVAAFPIWVMRSIIAQHDLNLHARVQLIEAKHADETSEAKVRADVAAAVEAWMHRVKKLEECAKALEARDKSYDVDKAVLSSWMQDITDLVPKLFDRMKALEGQIKSHGQRLDAAVAEYEDHLVLVECVKALEAHRATTFDDNCASAAPEKCQECAIGENDLSVEFLEKLPPSSLALRVIALTTSHAIIEKMWHGEKIALADLEARVAQFVEWIGAVALINKMDQAKVIDKLRELGLVKEEEQA